MAGDVNRLLFRAMLKEELRLQRSFIGTIAAAFFPVMIFIMSLILAMTFPLLQRISTETVLLIIHLGFFLYGLGVGALSFIGEEVMTRRLGQTNMLLQLPQWQPVSFKRVMGIFYLKDALFYIVYSIIPLIAGIAVAAPLADIPFTSVALLALTTFLTFMLGMSLSFLISALAVRSRLAVAPIGIIGLVLFLLVWPFDILQPGHVIVPLGFWAAKDGLLLLVSGILVIVLSIIAVVFSRERFEEPHKTYTSRLLPTEKAFSFVGGSRTLVAKEWVEVRRSGTLSPIIFEYLAPLGAVYILAWIFRTGLDVPIEFNTIFYGGMVGFLGVMVYSWLTNLEPNEFLNAQPASVDQVIRAKIILYFLLTAVVSFSYVVVIGVVNGEYALLPLSLLIAGATTVYVAGVIARLTGIWTNTMLFDARVLAKFAGAVVPPLIVVMVASFVIHSDTWIAVAVLLIESSVLLLVSIALLRGLTKRWRREHFSFATSGSVQE